jgi:hypothetical protein
MRCFSQRQKQSYCILCAHLINTQDRELSQVLENIRAQRPDM